MPGPTVPAWRAPAPVEAGAALVLFDSSGTVIVANAAADALLDAAPGSLLGTPGATPSGRPAVRGDGSPLPPGQWPSERVLRDGQPVLGEVLGLVRRDTTITWVLASAAALPPHGGQPGGVMVSLVDITASRRAEARLGALNASGDAVALLSEDGTLQAPTGALEHLTGRGPGTLAGIRLVDLFHEDDRDATTALLHGVPAGQASGATVVRLDEPGTARTLELVAMNLLGDPDVRAVLVHLRDIGHRAPVPASALTDHFRATFEHAPVGMALADMEGRYQQVNPAFCQLLGRTAADLVGRSLTEVAHPEDGGLSLDYHRRLMRQEITSYQLEQRYVRSDGASVWARLVASSPPQLGDEPRYAICQIVDITEMKGVAERLSHAATHDPLTGLPNRALLFDRLDVLLRRRSRHPSIIAALFVDLDRFKPVNDTYGHAVGDQVLTQAARRVHAAVRPGDTVSRFGGDEFVVLCDELQDPSQAIAVAERVVGVFDRPIVVDGHSFEVGASVGVVLVEPDTPVDADDLVQAADAALYRAKDAGGRCVAVGALGQLRGQSEATSSLTP